MYMSPVVRARAPAPKALRMAVGAPTLLLASAVMLPWLALIGVGSALVLSVKLLAATPRALVQAIDDVGGAVLDR